MDTETTPAFPWNPQGKKARIVDTRFQTNEITITTFSAHVKVHNLDRTLRVIVFESPYMTRVAEEMSALNDEEFALAFKGVEDNSANDVEFARSKAARVGVRGKFVRNHDELIVFCYSEKLKKTFEISVFLDDDIKKRMALFL